MQKEQVEPRQAQALQAAFDRLPQQRFDIARRRIAEVAFAGDPDALRQPAAKGLADHQLGLAVAVTRREVEQVDPGATAACTVATHSSNVVSPHTMPRPPPPRVSVETGGSDPKECCSMCFRLSLS